MTQINPATAGAQAGSDDVLRVEDLRVSFDTIEGRFDAVRGVSFRLGAGKTVAVVGESGSGKSVTSYAILRLIQRPGRITGGRILFRPKGSAPFDRVVTEGAAGDPLSYDIPARPKGSVPFDIAALPDNAPELFQLRGGQIGMIFQEPMTALSPVHSIGNQLCEAVRLHRGAGKREAREIACDMLARVGITEPRRRLDQYPFEFSGGMRQRVVIAMALVCKPQVLIADEPTTALDVTVQAQILKLIAQLRAEMGTSVIFITHDLGVVAQVADEVVVMNQGVVMEAGPVRQIFKSPFHPYTKRLLSAVPRFDEDDTYSEQIHAAASDEIPAGYTLTPPNEDYRADHPSTLHELSEGRKLLLWAELEHMNV